MSTQGCPAAQLMTGPPCVGVGVDGTGALVDRGTGVFMGRKMGALVGGVMGVLVGGVMGALVGGVTGVLVGGVTGVLAGGVMVGEIGVGGTGVSVGVGVGVGVGGIGAVPQDGNKPPLIRETPEPSAFIVYISPPDVKAMRRPSGDQDGLRLSSELLVRRVTPEPSAFIVYISWMS